MRLLSLCICVGVLLCLVEINLAKKRDENAIDVSEEIKEQDDEDGDFELFACSKDKGSICTCEDDKLTCEKVTDPNTKQLLSRTDIYIRDHEFIPKTVSLSKNQISELIFRALMPGFTDEVERLDLSHNIIEKIEPKTFNAFYILIKLDLSSNKLKTVSNTYLTSRIGDTLHELFLEDNQIKKIPATAFQELKNLKKLSLDGNVNLKVKKSSFPSALAKLEELSLDRCNITDLDDDVFSMLVNLKKLSLRSNPIIQIPKAINAIPNLIALEMSYTEIVELNKGQIDSDHKLSEIRLSNMPYLYAVHECAFCGLPNLTKVYLSNNSQLYDFHENAFGAITAETDSKFVVPTLTEFDIHDSNFSTLPKKLFDWTNVKVLKIHGNPFTCDCGLAWLINNKTLQEFETIPKCAKPESLNGTLFSKLDNHVCDGKTEASTGGTSFVMWGFVMFLTVVGLVGGFLLYTRRIKVTNVLYRPEVPEMGYSNLTAQHPHREDEEELQDDFQPRPNASPV